MPCWTGLMPYWRYPACTTCLQTMVQVISLFPNRPNLFANIQFCHTAMMAGMSILRIREGEPALHTHHPKSKACALSQSQAYKHSSCLKQALPASQACTSPVSSTHNPPLAAQARATPASAHQSPQSQHTQPVSAHSAPIPVPAHSAPVPSHSPPVTAHTPLVPAQSAPVPAHSARTQRIGRSSPSTSSPVPVH